MTKAYMAIVKTPIGVWESTASVCTGHEAELRAKRQAQRAFVLENMPPFMTRNLDMLIDSFWRTAVNNGCKIILKEVDIQDQ